MAIFLSCFDPKNDVFLSIFKKKLELFSLKNWATFNAKVIFLDVWAGTTPTTNLGEHITAHQRPMHLWRLRQEKLSRTPSFTSRNHIPTIFKADTATSELGRDTGLPAGSNQKRCALRWPGRHVLLVPGDIAPLRGTLLARRGALRGAVAAGRGRGRWPPRPAADI